MAKLRLVTLLTDFGTRDPYVAVMKGVLLARCPQATVVDATHEIAPQDVLEAAFVLGQTAAAFPPGTLHVVVVDPGVGTQRRILAGRLGGRLFLVPDNGVLTFVAQTMPTEALHLVSSTRYLPPGRPSATFHGRDIFAPVAAHLLNGVAVERLGPPAEKYKVLDLPAPTTEPGRIAGEVVYVDRFGNLVSNIPGALAMEHFADLERIEVCCGGRSVGGLQGTYGFVGEGEPLALINSMDRIEVAVNCGRADEVLGVGIGAEVVLTAAGTP